MEETFFGLTDPGCPYLASKSEDGWTLVSYPGETSPRLAYRDEFCLFRKDQEWKIKLITVFYRGVLRLRDDLIFFHASALSVCDRGVMLVAPRKGGKSTTALALAGRGHSILSDSCACYRPTTGELIPFRRPIGIREGPRSRSVDETLRLATARAVYRDDSVRVDLDAILPPVPLAAVPLSAVLFLKGFADQTQLERITNARPELANLQPIYSSFANAPHTQRVFQLIQFLSRARLFAIRPGDPDEAARMIEEAVTS